MTALISSLASCRTQCTPNSISAHLAYAVTPAADTVSTGFLRRREIDHALILFSRHASHRALSAARSHSHEDRHSCDLQGSEPPSGSLSACFLASAARFKSARPAGFFALASGVGIDFASALDAPCLAARVAFAAATSRLLRRPGG